MKNSRISTNVLETIQDIVTMEDSYAIYGMVPMTLSDRWPRFQGHDILQRQITQNWYNGRPVDYGSTCISDHLLLLLMQQNILLFW